MRRLALALPPSRPHSLSSPPPHPPHTHTTQSPPPAPCCLRSGTVAQCRAQQTTRPQHRRAGRFAPSTAPPLSPPTRRASSCPRTARRGWPWCGLAPDRTRLRSTCATAHPRAVACARRPSPRRAIASETSRRRRRRRALTVHRPSLRRRSATLRGGSEGTQEARPHALNGHRRAGLQIRRTLRLQSSGPRMMLCLALGGPCAFARCLSRLGTSRVNESAHRAVCPVGARHGAVHGACHRVV